MGQKLMLNNVRCAFLVLGEPEEFKPGDGRPRWSATALVSYTDAQVKSVVATLQAVAKEKWEKKWEAYYEAIIADPKGTCWTDGKRKPDYDGFAQHWALSAHRPKDKGRPLVMDIDKSPIYQADNSVYNGKGGRIYSGCFVNMQVEIWAQENANGKGLRATLLGIQRFKDGDAFGGGAAPNADEFAEIADGADADDLA
jgi:hypothetical protein